MLVLPLTRGYLQCPHPLSCIHTPAVHIVKHNICFVKVMHWCYLGRNMNVFILLLVVFLKYLFVAVVFPTGHILAKSPQKKSLKKQFYFLKKGRNVIYIHTDD